MAASGSPALLKKWQGNEGGKIKVFFQSDEDDEDIMASFRTLTKQGIFDSEETCELGKEGYLCFRIKLKHHKAKSKDQPPTLYVSCPDLVQMADVLLFLEPYVNCDSSSSAFMTKDFYGIRSAQTAASIFMKYGNSFELHTGVHLNQVGWHMRG